MYFFSSLWEIIPLQTCSLPYYKSLMAVYESTAEYEKDLAAQSLLPEGFRVSTGRLEFHPAELPGDKLFPMNTTLIEVTGGTDSFAGVFTRNAFPGAPVLLCRERIGGHLLRGVLVNNKVANVCAPGGLESAKRVTDVLAEHAGGRGSEYLYASTGVIGWRIPETEISASLEPLVKNLQSETVLPAAKSIMTTDRFAKVRSVEVDGVRIVGIAKGAGMIEPNMATMLAFILTDADLDRTELKSALKIAVEDSFNAISVDSDQSTSDMAIILSSRKSGRPDADAFAAALKELCRLLAGDIVRNGEGTSHVIELSVSGAPSRDAARGIAKAIVNSPLVKTAIYGNDPNLGRLVAALGDYAGNHGIVLDPASLHIRFGGYDVFAAGEFNLSPEKETAISDLLLAKSFSPELKGYPEHYETVSIEINLNKGSGSALVWGSDLSYEYVRENAEYRS